VRRSRRQAPGAEGPAGENRVGRSPFNAGDIDNGALKSPDVGNNSLTGNDIKNLTGADINEATLGDVPTATRALDSRARSVFVYG
jgi:hypothetical protein